MGDMAISNFGRSVHITIADIEENWARHESPPPFQIYVKMACHLAEEARAGLFTIPADMRNSLEKTATACARRFGIHLKDGAKRHS